MGVGTTASVPGAGVAPCTPDEKIRLVREFEGLFLAELWRAMSRTVDMGGEGGGLFGGHSSDSGAFGPYGAIMDAEWVNWMSGTSLGNLGSGIEEALAAAIDRGELPVNGPAGMGDAFTDAFNGGSPGLDTLRARTLYTVPAVTPALSASEDVRAFDAISTRVLSHDTEILEASRDTGIDPNLLRAVIHQESGGNPAARSARGAMGLMQLMPDTARVMGVRDPGRVRENVLGGARYLRTMLTRFGGNVRHALAAYNAGPGAVEKAGGIPPYAETRAYVPRVLALAETYRASSAAGGDPMVDTGGSR
jgi:soluble lytic murein transglycosylase-like protein